MLRTLLLTLLALTLALPVVGQDLVPDYAIRNIRSRFSDNGRQTVVEFEVWNIGGEAEATATAKLNVIATGLQIATDVVPPLRSTQIHTVSLTFPTALFPADSVQSLRATVGVDEVEPTGSQNLGNNFAQISITFPPRLLPEATPEGGLTETTSSGDPIADFLARFGIQFDINDAVQVVTLVGIAGAGLVLFVLVAIILVLLLQRPPRAENWQPSYTNLLPLDPNSTSGRRQQWQGHAQNSALPPFCQEGQFHARKQAIGLNGASLSNWRASGIRLTQYDMYGRVSRSEVIARPRLVRRLDRVMRRSGKLDTLQISNRLRPVARRLVNQLRRNLNPRNVMLPLALDTRMQGKHGEVRILFELYQCRGDAWQLIDTWEPEMTVVGKALQETYTYSLYGQRPGETPRAFHTRLQDDLTQALTAMLVPPPPSAPQDFNTPTNPHVPPVDSPSR